MSGRKNIINAHRIIIDGNMASNITSEAVDVSRMDNISVEAIYTGSPNGTLTLQGSNSKENWASVNTSENIAISSASNDIMVFANYAFKWARVVYTASSGSGTLNCYLTAKEL